MRASAALLVLGLAACSRSSPEPGAKRRTLADRYFQATRTRPTLRQFRGITP